jgi:hypothetical protein
MTQLRLEELESLSDLVDQSQELRSGGRKRRRSHQSHDGNRSRESRTTFFGISSSLRAGSSIITERENFTTELRAAPEGPLSVTRSILIATSIAQGIKDIPTVQSSRGRSAPISDLLSVVSIPTWCYHWCDYLRGLSRSEKNSLSHFYVMQESKVYKYRFYSSSKGEKGNNGENLVTYIVSSSYACVSIRMSCVYVSHVCMLIKRIHTWIYLRWSLHLE